MKTMYLLVTFTFLLLLTSINAKDFTTPSAIYIDYAREHLQKYGLAKCLSETVNSPSLKKNFTQASIYYFNLAPYGAESIGPNTLINSLTTFANILPSNDINAIQQCLNLFHSAHYRASIQSYDSYIIENYFIELTTISYSPLKTNNEEKLSKWGFYNCLINISEEVQTKKEIFKEIRTIENDLHHIKNLYPDIAQRYDEAFNRYIFPQKNPLIKDKNYLGCIILYDSSELNSYIHNLLSH